MIEANHQIIHFLWVKRIEYGQPVGFCQPAPQETGGDGFVELDGLCRLNGCLDQTVGNQGWQIGGWLAGITVGPGWPIGLGSHFSSYFQHAAGHHASIRGAETD